MRWRRHWHRSGPPPPFGGNGGAGIPLSVEAVKGHRFDPDRLIEADERRSATTHGSKERRKEETVEVQFGNERGEGASQAGVPSSGAAPPVMPASTNGARGTGPLLRSIAADISTLVSKQIELAKQEIGEMVGTRAKAVGVFGAAAVLGLFVIGFLGLAGAEALDLVLPRWAAMLIVAGVFGAARCRRVRAGPRMAPLERIQARAHPRVLEGGRPMGETAAETMKEIDATGAVWTGSSDSSRAGCRPPRGWPSGPPRRSRVWASWGWRRGSRSAGEEEGRRPPRP